MVAFQKLNFNLIVFVCLILSTSAFHVKAELISDEYIALSGAEKAALHEQKAIETPRTGLPTNLGQMVRTGPACAAMLFASYGRQVLNWENPAEVDAFFTWFRRLTGKPIHAYGVTARGVVSFANLLANGTPATGLFANTEIPVTIRYSLAGPHFPLIEKIFNSGLSNYHPGFMISMHLDGKPDLNLFLMPPQGLDGTTDRVNPFTLTYTHRIDFPKLWGMNLLAKLTFSRLVTNPGEQSLDAFASFNKDGTSVTGNPNIPHQLYFQPDLQIVSFYTATLGPREALNSWPVPDDRVLLSRSFMQGRKLFNILPSMPGPCEPVGTVTLMSPWRMSKWGDSWYAPHSGFEELE